jgi:hypothetical protein
MTTPKQTRMTFICNQDWESMSLTANGRFCEVCNHEVVDFSEKSLEELALVKSSRNGNFCGRFKVSPDPNIVAPISTPRTLKILTIFSSIFLFVSTKTLSAQTNNRNQTEQTDQKNGWQTNSDTIYLDCDSSRIHVTDSSLLKDKPKPFLTTKRKEYYWTKKFPFITKTYKPIKAPTLIMGRYL